MTVLKHIRRLACLAAVGIAALGWASPARAQMTLTITDVNTGSFISIPDGGTGDVSYTSLPGSFGNYRINQISGSANYNGNTDGNPNTGDANVLNTVLRVTQTGNAVLGGGTSNSDSLIITITTAGTANWTIPAGTPVLLSSTLAVSRLDGSNGTSTGTFSTFASTLTDSTSPTPNSTTVIAPNAYSAITTTNSGPAKDATPPFFLSNVLSLNTTGINQVVNLSASTDVTAIAPVPEPSTGILALSGGLLMLAFGWRQKQRHGVE